MVHLCHPLLRDCGAPWTALNSRVHQEKSFKVDFTMDDSMTPLLPTFLFMSRWYDSYHVLGCEHYSAEAEGGELYQKLQEIHNTQYMWVQSHC
jgi:hypothetical protein